MFFSKLTESKWRISKPKIETKALQREGGAWRFVKKPCRKIGICRVFSYEGGAGEVIFAVTSFMDDPLIYH